MENKKIFRISADIGGFPRAAVFDAKQNQQFMDLVYEDQLSITGIRPDVKDRTDVKRLVDNKGRFVFPNRIGSIQVFYNGFEVDAVLDLDANNNAAMDIYNVESPGTPVTSMNIDYDRWYQTALDAKPDGLLSIAFQPSELRLRPKIKTDDLNGIYTVGIRRGGQKASVDVVFDKRPLKESAIECIGPNILYKGGTIGLSIQADDGPSGSGIKSAIFAISKSTRPDSFRDGDSEQNKPEDAVGNKVNFSLDSKDFEKKFPGEYWVVARTFDLAGNQQDKNKALKINWTGKEKPPAPK